MAIWGKEALKSTIEGMRISREQYLRARTPYPLDGSITPSRQITEINEDKPAENVLTYSGPDFSQ